MRKKLFAALVASACTFSVSGPAYGQRFQEYGPEQVGYVYCYWGAGYHQVAVSQIEEVRWRDGIQIFDNGNRFIGAHIGTYLGSVKREFDERLGLSDNTECEFESTRSYGRREPGSSFEAYGGGTVQVTLKEVDPSWFVSEHTAENVTVLSLAGKKKLASPPKPKPKPAAESAEKAEKQPVPAGPTPAEIAADKHRAVEERNRAAQAQYEADLAEQQRKVDEFNRLTAEMERKKAEQQAEAQRALDGFKAEQAAHAQQMLQHQQQLSDYQNKLGQQGKTPPAKGGRFQATSAIVDTREAAMAALMRLPVPGQLTDIQCDQVKFFTPPKWTCWGFYQTEVKPSAASAQ